MAWGVYRSRSKDKISSMSAFGTYDGRTRDKTHLSDEEALEYARQYGGTGYNLKRDNTAYFNYLYGAEPGHDLYNNQPLGAERGHDLYNNYQIGTEPGHDLYNNRQQIEVEEDEVPSAPKKARLDLAGQFNYQPYNHKYLGPGNPINNGEAIDTDDVIAAHHDSEYARQPENVANADLHSIKDFGIDAIVNNNPHSAVGAIGLAGKYLLEKVIGQQYPGIYATSYSKK